MLQISTGNSPLGELVALIQRLKKLPGFEVQDHDEALEFAFVGDRIPARLPIEVEESKKVYVRTAMRGLDAALSIGCLSAIAPLLKSGCCELVTITFHIAESVESFDVDGDDWDVQLMLSLSPSGSFVTCSFGNLSQAVKDAAYQVALLRDILRLLAIDSKVDVALHGESVEVVITAGDVTLLPDFPKPGEYAAALQKPGGLIKRNGVSADGKRFGGLNIQNMLGLAETIAAIEELARSERFSRVLKTDSSILCRRKNLSAVAAGLEGVDAGPWMVRVTQRSAVSVEEIEQLDATKTAVYVRIGGIERKSLGTVYVDASSDGEGWKLHFLMERLDLPERPTIDEEIGRMLGRSLGGA
ncbi:MAG: hypothetical protein JXA90_11960 [Planctomycetes bacterium]|nr:hypothetical protein [Planctomycetota bacterium]